MKTLVRRSAVLALNRLRALAAGGRSCVAHTGR